MRALITGGAGFIGSHLAEALLQAGHQVTAVDNLSTGAPNNVAHLEGHPRFRLVVESVLDEGVMRPLVAQAEVVYHLAAAVGVRWIIENPLLSIHTNIRATEVVMECAADSGTKVLLASTSEVYGKNEKRPLSEDDDSVLGATTITRWLYANSKATDEFLAFAYHRERGLPVVVVRFFNTVGPRQTGRYGMVVPRFVQQALRGEPITIHGDGQQTRCFTDVRDAVEAVIRLSQAPEAVGQVFNIGNSREITIEGLARLVVELTRSCSELRYLPYDEVYPAGFEDMRRRVPCVDKLQRVLGWSPQGTLEDNLLRIIDYFQSSASQAAGSPRAEVAAAR